MADSEECLKWWPRYIIVPLIGGGGIIVIMVAIISRPQFPRNTVPHGAPINQVISGTPAEKTPDKNTQSRTEPLIDYTHPQTNDATTQRPFGAALKLEDTTGQHWKLRDTILRYNH